MFILVNINMENKDYNFEYLTPENYKIQLDIWFKAYNISHEKVNLFHDFLFTLFKIVEETYLGPDVTITDSDQKNHFLWCWNKTISLFSEEKIIFKDKGIHFEYFWNFFHEAYYYNHMINVEIKIKEYLNIIFDFKRKKTRAELDVLHELYKLLNESLKK